MVENPLIEELKKKFTGLKEKPGMWETLLMKLKAPNNVKTGNHVSLPTFLLETAKNSFNKKTQPQPQIKTKDIKPISNA